MGMTISDMRTQQHNSHQDNKILILGLDSSGKTAILQWLLTNSLVHVFPTIGFNVETIHTAQGEHLTLWDISGPLWGHFLQGNDALVFVVDSADYERISEAKDTLWWIVDAYDRAMNSMPVVLVYANKQDRRNAMTVEEIKDAMNVENLPSRRDGRHRRWHVQGASALVGDGLWEGVDWLCAQIKDVHSPGGGESSDL